MKAVDDSNARSVVGLWKYFLGLVAVLFTGFILVGMFLPDMRRTRPQHPLELKMDRLQQALLEYQKREPLANLVSKQEVTGLSWRVHLLPYLDQGQLYGEFHLDEPWSSKHNRVLIDRLPPDLCWETPAGGVSAFRWYTPDAVLETDLATPSTVVPLLVAGYTTGRGAWTAPDVPFQPKAPEQGSDDWLVVLFTNGEIRACLLEHFERRYP